MYKFIVLCALIVAASAVSKPNAYKSSNSRPAASHSSASSDDAHAQVNSFSSDVREDGFQYAFDTSNGIQAAASGAAQGDIKGDFSWISPEGEHISIQYVADENGYQPQGDLLPTPPPIPKAILKSLEYLRSHPSSEDSNQGQYSSPVRSIASKPAKKFGKRF